MLVSREEFPAALIPSPPKLRTDLTLSHQQAAGEARCVVKDPSSGKFFRFGELEQFIAEQLDGETPLDVVRARTEARFAAPLAPESLAGFVRSLAKSGLLQGEGEAQDRGARSPG